MLRDLSTNSSVPSTHKESNEPMQHAAFGHSLGTRHKREINPAHKKDNTSVKKVETGHTSANHSTTSNTDQRYDPEFETLLRATKYFIDTIQQLYHPLIAEYISTANAWSTLQLQLGCLAMELPQEHWSGAPDMAMAKNKTQKMSRAAASQLLSLRKACFREGLTESLQEVDVELNLDEGVIQKWTEAVETAEKSVRGFSRLQLESLGLRDPAEVKKDHLTRTNEWILGVFYASPFSINFHRSIYDDVVSGMERKHVEAVHEAIRDRDREGERNTERKNVEAAAYKALQDKKGGKQKGNRALALLSPENISHSNENQEDETRKDDQLRYLRQEFLSNDVWQRMMLKFWFLDSAAEAWSPGPPSATVESDATEVPFFADDVEELLDGGAEPGQQGQSVLKQPAYRSIESQDIDQALVAEIEMPPPNVPPEKAAEACLVLEAYALEPIELS
jgi:hypothetical protein